MYLPPETELWLLEQRRNELQEQARQFRLAAAAREARRRSSGRGSATLASLARRLRATFARS